MFLSVTEGVMDVFYGSQALLTSTGSRYCMRLSRFLNLKPNLTGTAFSLREMTGTVPPDDEFSPAFMR